MGAPFDKNQNKDPRSFRTGFDKRAPRVIRHLRETYADPDQLLTRARVAYETDTSFQTWEILAHRRRGPRYESIGTQAAYRISDLIEWLELRAQIFTERHPETLRPTTTLHAMENVRRNNRAEADA